MRKTHPARHQDGGKLAEQEPVRCIEVGLEPVRGVGRYGMDHLLDLFKKEEDEEKGIGVTKKACRIA